MEILIFTLSEFIYYIFLSFLIASCKSFYLANSCILLFLFSMLIYMPSLLSIKIIKNRKKYFIVSNILIISASILIFIFRNFTHNGLINFTFHLYTILFMFVPFFSIFALSIHKLYIPIKKRKQLIFLIVFKKISIILLAFIFSYFFKFNHTIIFISIIDFIFNIISPLIIKCSHSLMKNTKNI